MRLGFVDICFLIMSAVSGFSLYGWAECIHGAEEERKQMQSKAVELGAATWVVDPKTGETTFTWKESK